jgi:hypothetical protein
MGRTRERPGIDRRRRSGIVLPRRGHVRHERLSASAAEQRRERHRWRRPGAPRGERGVVGRSDGTELRVGGGIAGRSAPEHHTSVARDRPRPPGVLHGGRTWRNDYAVGVRLPQGGRSAAAARRRRGRERRGRAPAGSAAARLGRDRERRAPRSAPGGRDERTTSAALSAGVARARGPHAAASASWARRSPPSSNLRTVLVGSPRVTVTAASSATGTTRTRRVGHAVRHPARPRTCGAAVMRR